jgi:ubiquinone/menaquinone biosynthesis C-methylase UbiE
MSDCENAANLRVYNSSETVSFYSSLDCLTPCEQFVFFTNIKRGADILDVGVGGGRTTAFLSRMAARYVGVDYSAAMIQSCRSRFPELEFLVSDASDLSAFAESSFDAVVMALNVMDTVLPDENRWAFLRECQRVLRVGGVLIFSTHNPRWILARPVWSQERLRVFARRFVTDRSAMYKPFLFALTTAKVLHSCFRAAGMSVRLAARRIGKPAFWHGEGNLFDPVHGGLWLHHGMPKCVTKEVTQFGLTAVRWVGDNYPRTSGLLTTNYYYYVFKK